VSIKLRGGPDMFRPPLTFTVERKSVDCKATEPIGGGYTWPLMKDTLFILTAERLEVMIGRLPVLVMPPLNKTVDAFRSPVVFRTPVTLTEDKLLILALVMKFWPRPRTVSPPSIKTVEANMVEGVAPVTPTCGG
jgi:hypothetical protein